MKKLFTLCLGLLAVMTLEAQGADNNESSSGNKIWWGYFNESDLKTFDGTVGIGQATPFLTGIAVPANHDIVGSGTIKAVRIYLANGIPSTISELAIWISKTLPSSIDAADYSQTVSGSLVVGANDIELTTPYAINNEAFYVGYYIKSSNAYPIRTGGKDLKDAFWICAPGNISWTDLNGQNLGKLAFQICVDGATLKSYSVSAADMGNVYGQTGKTAVAQLSVTNNGEKPLTSIGYTISGEDATSEEFHADLTSPITFGQTATVAVTIPADEEQGVETKVLMVTKANGEVNESTDNKSRFTLYSLSEMIDRNVVVEEYTGTGCGWCPRGLVGMDKLRNTFGNRFVGIGIHRYNSSDAMYIANYAPVTFSGAPSCRINRGNTIDPYYGTGSDICDDFRAEMSIPAFAHIAASGKLNEEFTTVDASASVKPMYDGTYSVEFALIADGLKGTGSGWNQSNYYYQYTSSQLPEDLAIFGKGGTYGTSSVSGWTFNDVVIASSFVNKVNQVEQLTLSAGEEKELSYTLTLPTKATLKNALLKDELYVVAIMTDGEGKVVNAVKNKVSTGEASAVRSLSVGDDTVVSRYTIDGRQVTAPQRGINIVKMSDGTTRKVVIK